MRGTRDHHASTRGAPAPGGMKPRFVGEMRDLLSGRGFLGTSAPLISDLSLILVLLAATMLTIGWQLARHRHYEPHRWVQTAAATINAIVVLGFMVDSYVTHILPGIPEKFLEGDCAVTTVHAVVGTIGFLLGGFIVLRANGLVPKALQFKNYKAFMRVSYWIYMLATLLGVVVYVLVFVLGI